MPPTAPTTAIPNASSSPAPIIVPDNTQNTTNKPNFLERLLPTAGGILGGIGGEALDVFGGGIGGAALGGALGQKLENALTGNQSSTLAAGAENAVGMGAGSILGKLFGGVAGIAAKGAGKGADALLAGQATPGLITPDLANELRTAHGVTDLSQAGKLANIYTGSSDSEPGLALINKAVENGIYQNGPSRVDLSDLTMRPVGGKTAAVATSSADTNGNLAQHFMTKNQLLPAQQNAVRANLSAITDSSGQTIGGQTDAAGALNFQRSVSQLANKAQADFLNSGRNDVNSLHLMNTYNDIANEANDRLFSPGGQDIQIPAAEKDALSSEVQKYAGPLNPNSAAQMTKDIQSANTYRDLRTVQAKWVNVNQALQKTADKAAQSYGTTTGDMVRAGLPIVGAVAGGPKGAMAGLAGAAVKSSAVDKAGSGVLDSLSKTAGSKTAKTMIPLLSKIGAVTAANVPNEIPQSQSGVQSNINPTGAPSAIPGAAGANMQQSPYDQAISIALHQMQVDPFDTQAASLVQSALPQLQKAGAANAQLQGVGQELGNAGGSQGLLGGILSKITGLIPGTPQAALNAGTGQLANTLGVPQGAVPGVMQSPNTAALQQSILQQIIAAQGGGAYQPQSYAPAI